MSWFEKLIPARIRTDKARGKKKNFPEGLWHKCPACNTVLYKEDLERNKLVCPKCGHHSRLSGRQRLETFLDASNQEELFANLKPVDFLKFKDSKKYKDRISAAQKSTGEKDAFVVIKGEVHGVELVAAAFDFSFMGGSMGSVVGEKFVRAAQTAIDNNIPFIVFSASGGARMQEALTSLMQMAKTSSALAKLADAKLPYISVLTDPTMGGVSASFAMLGDVIIAEPNALIGFAGPRVIEQTVRETLPEGFQRSEFLIEKGAIDRIISRNNLRSEIADILCLMLHKPRPENMEVDDIIFSEPPKEEVADLTDKDIESETLDEPSNAV